MTLGSSSGYRNLAACLAMLAAVVAFALWTTHHDDDDLMLPRFAQLITCGVVLVPFLGGEELVYDICRCVPAFIWIFWIILHSVQLSALKHESGLGARTIALCWEAARFPRKGGSSMRILMLGNSLTSANDLPQTLSRLTGAQVVAHTRGGARLAEQLNPDTRLGAATRAALHDECWDFVVLQESSNGPIVHRESFLRACSGLCELVRAAGAEPVLFATWAYRADNPGLARMGLSREEIAAALASAYREAAQAGGALVADVGSRFLAHPDPDALYAPDGLHPSAAGTLLAAQTLAEAIRAASAQDRPAPPKR